MSSQSDVRERFLRMQRQFGWKSTAPSTSTNPCTKPVDTSLTENINAVNQPDSVRNSPNQHESAAGCNTETCSICGVSMSVFLIDNHRRHCSRNQSKEEADDEMSIDQKEYSEQIERSDSDRGVDLGSESSRHSHQISALSTSLFSEQMTECRFCEIEEPSTEIEEHEMYCGSRTDLCPQCGQRDTVKNLVEFSHQCPAQCPPASIYDHRRDHIQHQNHQNDSTAHHLADILSGDDSDDIQFVDHRPNCSSNHNANYNGNHNENHTANHTANHNGNHNNNLNTSDHEKRNSEQTHDAESGPQTPALIRAERERLRQTRARNEERDHEFALNLQRELVELDAQQRQTEAEETERRRRQQHERERQMAQQERWRRQLLAEQEAERRGNLEAERTFDQLDMVFGGGLGPMIRAEVAEQENLDISNLSYEELEALFPVEAQGAREETLRRLPTEVYRKRDDDMNASRNDERNKCCICLEQFEDGDNVRRLQCMHIFHVHEIDNWLRRNRECPICRINVDEHL